MPAGPWLAPLISGLFGFGGQLLGGDDNPNQMRKSFDTNSEIDPRVLLKRLMTGINSVGAAQQKKMSEGVRLRSGPVQSAPGFSKDPASIDPSILERPGFDFGTIGPFMSPTRANPADILGSLGIGGRERLRRRDEGDLEPK